MGRKDIVVAIFTSFASFVADQRSPPIDHPLSRDLGNVSSRGVGSHANTDNHITFDILVVRALAASYTRAVVSTCLFLASSIDVHVFETSEVGHSGAICGGDGTFGRRRDIQQCAQGIR